MIYLITALFCLSIFVLGLLFGYKYRDIDDRLQSLQNRDEPKPTQIINPNPRRIPEQPETGTIVVNRKTPQQLEKEDEDEANRKAGLA
jgi:hypothetical protein